ncbi:D-alanine--D-alanine ligase family protein [Microbacterium ulmi]
MLVLSGGESSEHEVSVASGRDVAAALAETHAVVEVHIDRAGGWRIGGAGSPSFRMDEVLSEVADGTIVFPVLHGGWGEGGGLQAELERRGIRFVGCDAAASARALSKRATARACATAGVRVVPTCALDRAAYVADPGLVSAALRVADDGPVVVKPDLGGSSIGVHVVPRGRSLRAALDDVFAQDATALVQPLIEGREVSIAVWADPDGGLHASGASLLHLPADAAGQGFTFEHKYEGGGAVLEIPAELPGRALDELQAAAFACFAAVGCRDLARIDFFLHEDGRPVLNEINTIPGLRRTSHFPRLVAAAGVGYDELLDALVEAAAARASTPALAAAGRR